MGKYDRDDYSYTMPSVEDCEILWNEEIAREAARSLRVRQLQDLMQLRRSVYARLDPVPSRLIGVPVPEKKRYRKLDRMSRKLKARLPEEAPRREFAACPDCGGEGYQMFRPYSGPFWWRVCEACNGSGLKEVVAENEKVLEWAPPLVHEPLPDFDFGL